MDAIVPSNKFKVKRDEPTISPTTRPGKISFNQIDITITIKKGMIETHE